MSSVLIEIVPALISFSIAAFFLIRYAINKDKTKIIIATFTFIISGFIVQTSVNVFITKIDLIKNFADNYRNIFSIPIITFISTALGIFAGNKMLRFFLDSKERREISVLLTSSIDRQVTNLGFINLYASLEPDTKNIAYAKIYQSEFDNDEPFKIAFNRIGIYKESEIKLISDYYVQLRQCLNYTKRYFLESKSNNNSMIPIYRIIKTSLLFTQLTGLLCVYNFSINYSNSNKDELTKQFVNDYHKIIDEYVENFDYSWFYISNTKLIQDIIDRFNKLRKEYNRYNYFSDSNDVNSIYICRVSLNKLYSQTTVCNQTGNNIIQVFINKNDDIVAFGNSKKESKEKCVALIKNTLETLLSPQEIDDLLNQQNFESYIISLSN